MPKSRMKEPEGTWGEVNVSFLVFHLCFILSALLVNLSFDYPEGGLLVVLCGIKLLVVIKLVYTNFKTQYFALRIARCHLVAAMFVILKIPRPLFLRQNGTHKIIKQQTPRSHEN